MTVKPLLKKTVKFFLWFFACIIFLFISLALLLQVPAVQNFAAQKTTEFLQKKTGTHISLERIDISFPKSVSLKNLLVLDLQNDTLLYTGELEVTLQMLSLLKSEIKISSVNLTDAYAKISRTEADSLYNFNFIIESFAGKNKNSPTPKKEGKDLLVKSIALENIRFLLDDKYAGLHLNTNIRVFEASFNETDLNHLHFDAGKIQLDGFHGTFTQTKIPEKNSHTTKNALPYFKADKILISNSNFNLLNKVEQEAAAFHIGDFTVSNLAVDLQKENIRIETIDLSKSFAQLTMRSAKDSIKENLPVATSPKKENNLNVHIASIHLSDNAFYYKDPSIPKKSNDHFNPSDFQIKEISLRAGNALYSPNLSQIVIAGLALNANEKIKIQSLKGSLKMTARSIEATALYLQTKRSSLEATSRVFFKSLDEAKTNPEKIKFDFDIRQLKLYHPELSYFLPDLKSEPFLIAPIYTNLKTKLSGSLDNITATNLQITTAASTKLYGNIQIKGLPDLKQLEANVPGFTIQSSRKDLQTIAGNRLPNAVQIPDSLKINFGISGTMKDFKTNVVVNSTSGSLKVKGNLSAGTNYNIYADIFSLNVAHILNNKSLPEIIDGTLTIRGSGFDTNSVNATVQANLERVRINEYTYKDLSADVQVIQKSFTGTVAVKDEYADLDLSGKVDLNGGQKHFDINLDLKGADLMKLNLTKQDLRISFKALANIKGSSISDVNGTAGITGIILSKSGKKYILDSLLFAAINEHNNNSIKVKSAVIGINYKGTFAPAKFIDELKLTLNNYLPIDTSGSRAQSSPQNFDLEIEFNNHPVIAEVFLPELKAFEPGKITASYNGNDKQLNANIEIKRLHYADIELEDFKTEIKTDESKLTYSVKAEKITNADLQFNNFITDGEIENSIASTHISADDETGTEKINLRFRTELKQDVFKTKLEQFALLEQEWNLSKNNLIVAGKPGINIQDFQMNRNETSISIQSATALLNSDLNFIIKNLKLEDLASIIQKDTLLLSGNTNGQLQLKRSNKSWGIISDFSINDLHFREIPLGNLRLEADNNATNQFDIDLKLSGQGNALHAFGNFKPSENTTNLDLQVEFRPLTMKSLEAFSMGQISQSKGSVSGKLNVNGTLKEPEITGDLTFEEAILNPVILNSPLYLKNEKIVFDKQGIHLKSFTARDINNNPAYINGSVITKNLKDIKFDLNILTNNFLILNTTKKGTSDYYGTLVVDSRIRVRGNPSHPVITSSVKLKDKSYFTFFVPESKLTTDKGEGVVLFTDSTKFHPILTRDQKTEKQKSTLKNLDISSTIEIDKRAILKLLLDPASEDSLVVKGTAALSFALDPSGKITLTGLYNVEDGSYVVSMENLLKRKFRISTGSTITWNGDPLDATINLNAFYSLRTSPVDLVADQLEPSERNQFRQRFPFLVYLNLKGALLTPEISFDIQLPPSDRGAMNGMLHARLEQLKENPNALNKQVFALLVLGRFIQENPLETEGSGGTAAAARTTVGNFLSAQLNKLTSRMVPGVDINFDVQSYDDYSTGNAQGRTEVGLGVSKQLFDDRVSVQVGGSVDVEGERAKQNNASDIAGDVSVEYKLTRDGRYRLKGFRLNQYAGALDGQIIQTGAGLLYTRDFETWFQLISKEAKEKKAADSLNAETKVYDK